MNIQKISVIIQSSQLPGTNDRLQHLVRLHVDPLELGLPLHNLAHVEQGHGLAVVVEHVGLRVKVQGVELEGGEGVEPAVGRD